jgi:hypothetical protein
MILVYSAKDKENWKSQPFFALFANLEHKIVSSLNGPAYQ